MATSFITKNDKYGFWIADSLMQIVCWGILKTIDSNEFPKNEDWLKVDFRELAYNNAQGYFNGFMYLDLHKFLIDQERISIFNKVIVDTKVFFLQKGDTFSPEEFEKFKTDSKLRRNWSEPIETKRLLNILDYLSDVVNDKITTTASDPIIRF